MEFRKIVTHGGDRFQLGELLSIAYLRHYFGDLPVERADTVSKEDLEDSHVFVVQTGRRHEPEKSNFDHHQIAQNTWRKNANKHFDSSVLIAHWLVEKKIMHSQIFYEIISFLREAAAMELGCWPENAVVTLNFLVSNFNSVPSGFDRALTVVQEIVDAQLANAEENFDEYRRWSSRAIANGVAVIDEYPLPYKWQQFATRTGVLFVIRPRKKKGWMIVSRNPSKFPIPSVPNGLGTIRVLGVHEALCDSLEDAKTYAMGFAQLYKNSVKSVPEPMPANPDRAFMLDTSSREGSLAQPAMKLGAKDRWEQSKREHGVVVFTTNEPTPLWQQYAEREHIFFRVGAEQGRWKITSRSRFLFPIQKIELYQEGEIKIENNKRTAWCSSFEYACAYARALAEPYVLEAQTASVHADIPARDANDEKK